MGLVAESTPAIDECCCPPEVGYPLSAFKGSFRVSAVERLKGCPCDEISNFLASYRQLPWIIQLVRPGKPQLLMLQHPHEAGKAKVAPNLLIFVSC